MPLCPSAPLPLPYADLHVTSNFTFLTGASHPDELVQQAARLGHGAAAITDVNSLAGVVRAHEAAKQVGIPLAVGCRLVLGERDEWTEGRRGKVTEALIESKSPLPLSVLVFPTSRAAYGRLCRLLTVGKRRAPKGECRLVLHDLLEYQRDLLAVVLPPPPPLPLDEDFVDVLLGLRRVFDDDRLSLAACRGYGPDDAQRLRQLGMLAGHAGMPLVATNDVHYHDPRRRALQDVVTCIRLGCTIDEAGLRLLPNAERHLKAPEEMARLFAEFPRAVARSAEVALRTARGFSLDQLRYEYPDEVCPAGMTPMQHLVELTWNGAVGRYGGGGEREKWPSGRVAEGQRGGRQGIDGRGNRYEVSPTTWFAPAEQRNGSSVATAIGSDAANGCMSSEGSHRGVREEDAPPTADELSFSLSACPSLAVTCLACVPRSVRRQVEHELRLIDELKYAPYFLTVQDLVVYARSRGILCQGRGAAANSAVCYCLGVTAVDPARIDVLFERFVSRERDEPPDIDIDFEHERREEVIQYIYRKYGRDRAALTAEVISYRGRSAVREVGKALGLSLDCVDRLAKNMDWWDKGVLGPGGKGAREGAGEPRSHQRLRELGINPEDASIQLLIELATEILGFPRHLSQHVGGFVMTRGPLCESVPIENAAMEERTVIEWDKDDIDALGMLKVDVLGLGMLTCIRKCFDLVAEESPGAAKLTLATVPAEDPAVYEMICHADTVGVFQIESRAQMSMLPRLRPCCFYDLVIEVAIVRPGPIQGDMVHPYLRRRNHEELVSYPSEAVKKVLGKTLGVPLFQEQAMSLAMVAAGFTAGEADRLRRAIAAWKSRPNAIQGFREKLIDGMISRGYSLEFAERCFRQIQGFSGYGFPESHAASFALLVYVSAWLKKHHPTAFAAALINSQPMGFYAPAQIVRDAKEHGVEARAVDVNWSGWDCRLEESGKVAEWQSGKAEESGCSGSFALPLCHSAALQLSPALRLGMRLVRGLSEADARAAEAAVRERGLFRSVEALWRASGVRVSALRKLAAADAFGSMGLDRQAALWHIRELKDETLPLFDHPGQVLPPAPLPPTFLPPIPRPLRVVQDYAAIGLSLKAHPVSFMRETLAGRAVTPAAELRDESCWPTGSRIAVAGIVLVRQRPATASGIVFMTIEDETGIANLIVRPKIYQRYRRAARHGVMVLAQGRVERQGEVIHVLVNRINSVDDELPELVAASRDFH